MSGRLVSPLRQMLEKNLKSQNPALASNKTGMQHTLCAFEGKEIPCWANLQERIVYPMSIEEAAKYYPNLK